MRSVSIFCLLAVTLALFSAREARAETFRSEEFGIEIQVPKGWRRAPAIGRSNGVIVRFESPKEIATDVDGMRVRFRPALEVRRVLRKSSEGKETPARQPTDERGLGEFLRSICEASGEFVTSSVDDAEVGGRTGKLWRLDWRSRVGGRNVEQVTLGWEITTRDERFGLFSHMHLEHMDALVRTLSNSIAGVRFFAPKHTGVSALDSPPESSDLTPAELRQLREQATRAMLDRFRNDLPGDWTELEGEHFTAFSSLDEKTTRGVIRTAQDVREWLNTKLGYLGNGYVGRAVIVLFDDMQSLISFTSGQSSRRSAVPLVPTAVRGSFADPEMHTRFVRAWLQDRNPEIADALPAWLEFGLDEMLRAAELSKGIARLTSNEERTTWKRIHGAEIRVDARDFFSLRRQDIENSKYVRWQCGRFLHFLTDGPGSRSSRTKGLLERYLKQVIVFRTEQEDRRASSGGKALPATETEALQTVFDRTFADWKESDWKRFEASWKKACR